MEKDVTSAPEPEVVGMATKVMGISEAMRMALAQSMGLPPPRAMSSSGLSRRHTAAPPAASAAVGSGVTRSKISTRHPGSRAATALAMPFSEKNRSVTSNAALAEYPLSTFRASKPT